jgi:hypothetical protein
MEGADDLGALGRFGDWRIGLGELNAEADARDFDAFGRRASCGRARRA